jgi:two-component system, LytTR family, response regulator AlgR
MSLKVLIVDDEALARARLRTLLGDCREPLAIAQGEADSAVSAMQAVQREHFDVVLLDIHMPGADGMALARELRRLAHPPAVVFVTAHAEHAVAAFELEATDYLTKPVRLERLQAALQKVERTIQHPPGHLAELSQDVLIIQDRGRTERVALPEVIYFKAELKYVTVRTLDKSHILDGAISDLEARYGERFLRVHRNALVARHTMRALEKHHDPEEGDGWALRLAGVDDRVLVSRRQLAAVRAVISSVG